MMDRQTEKAQEQLAAARQCMEQHRTVEAIAHLTQAIALADGDGRVADVDASVADDGRVTDVDASVADGGEDIRDARRAVEAEARLLRGQLLLALGDKQGAEADMRRLLELDPRMGQVSGSFEAEGQEKARGNTRTMMNPYGL